MFRSVARHLIPPNGAYDLVNYLLDEDGSAYRRGGAEGLSPGFGPFTGVENLVTHPRADQNSTTGISANVSTVTTPVAPGGYGTRVFRGVATAPGAAGIYVAGTTMLPVTPGIFYSAGVKAAALAGPARVSIEWRDSGGVLSYTHGAHSSDLGARVVGGVAPPGAQFAFVTFYFQSAQIGDTMDVDGFFFAEGIQVYFDGDDADADWTGTPYASTSRKVNSSLRFIWDGFLAPGARTVIANPDDFAVLNASEVPINLGGSGQTIPKAAAELNGLLTIGGGIIYGGSRKAADYSTGTVALTNGSKTVTGTGTAFLANADAGMLIKRGAERYYVVASVDSDTQLTLRDAYAGATGTGIAYGLTRLGTAPKVSDIYATAGGRMFAAVGRDLFFSAPDDPYSWDPTDFHRLSGDIIGLAGIRDTLLIFTTDGYWVLSGIPLDLTDPFGNVQQRLEHVSRDVILVSHEGLATWSNAVVAPCSDGVYLLDGVSAPLRLSLSIDKLIRSYVGSGYRTGIANVFRSHYLLPIIDGSGVVQDQLVCRLDRPIRTRIGTVYPWTRQDGYGAAIIAWAVRTGGSTSSRSPALLGASTRSSARVAKCNSFFEPSAATKNDADGTTHEATIESRDYPTGDGRNTNTVKFVKLRYELIDAASDDPTISAAYSTGIIDETGMARWDEVNWDEFEWASSDEAEWPALTGVAPEDTGRNPYQWSVGKKARFIRFRFKSTDPAASLVLRTVQLRVRPTGKAQ